MVNPRKKKIYKSGIILGYKRSLRNQNMDKVRIRISCERWSAIQCRSIDCYLLTKRHGLSLAFGHK